MRKRRKPLFSIFYFLSSDRRGQSILEIIIALTILVTAIISAILVIFGGQSLSLDAQESNQAIRLAERELEIVEATARYDFAGLSSSSSTQNEFLKEIIVEDIGTSTKRITSRVSWQTDPLRVQQVELVTLVTDWQSSESSGGDTGGGGLSGNWNNPQTLGSVDLGPGNSATDLDVISKIVYMSAVASAESKPDFFTINANDGQDPFVVSNLDTGPGLNVVDVANSYAFAGQDQTTKQLQVIDVSNVANPILAAEYTLPGVSGSGAVGNAIFFYDDKIYIGTKHATGPEFHVIDVSTPIAPVSLGDFEVGADVNEIFVLGNTAYLATSDNAAELLVLDVSSSTSITQQGTYDAAGDYDGKGVYLRGTKLYLGREEGNSDELRILDVTDPASPQSLGVQSIGADVNNVAVRDNLAFLNVADANAEFQVWDISNPASIIQVSSFNFPQVANGLDYEDNLVYVAVRSNDALRIITSQ